MFTTKSPSKSGLPLFLGALILASAPACQGEASDVGPGDIRQGELAVLEGAMIEIVPSAELSQGDSEAVARWLEAQSKAHMVKVELKKEEGAYARLEVELWGEVALPDTLDVDLRAAFPLLADAEITQARLSGPPPEGEGHPHFKHEDLQDENPEVVKARIIEEMRAKGIEGEIVVDIKEDEDGKHRVEVHVKQHEDTPE